MDRIDDSSIMGNPYDWTRWKVQRRANGWVVVDALGNEIFETATEQEAVTWKEERRPPE
jgi:hypothetical protein